MLTDAKYVQPTRAWGVHSEIEETQSLGNKPLLTVSLQGHIRRAYFLLISIISESQNPEHRF